MILMIYHNMPYPCFLGFFGRSKWVPLPSWVLAPRAFAPWDPETRVLGTVTTVVR